MRIAHIQLTGPYTEKFNYQELIDECINNIEVITNFNKDFKDLL